MQPHRCKKDLAGQLEGFGELQGSMQHAGTQGSYLQKVQSRGNLKLEKMHKKIGFGKFGVWEVWNVIRWENYYQLQADKLL